MLLLSYNPNILETLNLVLKLSLIYPFLTASEDHRPRFNTNRSVTQFLAAADAHTFQDLLLFQLYNL